MKKRLTCLCLLALLLCLSPAFRAQEAAPVQWVTEDYVFVPAHQDPGEQQGCWLLVKGRAMDEAGLPTEVPALSGVVFGLYTRDARGGLVPWPDPKDPGKPATVTSGPGPVFIPLPQGEGLFLRQLSAPQGYYPVTEAETPLRPGQEVVLWNAMRGKLVVSAVSEAGGQLSGAGFAVRGPEGEERTLTTGLDGSAELLGALPGEYEITALAAPENRLIPEPATQRVQVADGRAAAADFLFPQMGSLSLRLATRSLDGEGKEETAPLSGERVLLLDGRGREIPDQEALLTDAGGSVQRYLPSGSYQVEVPEAYAGGYTLAQGRYDLEIRDGEVTRLTLTATASLGGLRVKTLALRGADQPATPAAKLAFWLSVPGEDVAREEAADASGEALFLDLAPGEYTLGIAEVPDGFAAVQEEWTVQVEPSRVAQAELTLASIEGQHYTLMGHQPTEQGPGETVPLPGVRLTVLREGETWAEAQTDEEGGFDLQLPLGGYTLAFAPGQEILADYGQEGALLSMPQEDPVVLPSRLGRLRLRSLDAEEKRLAGAVYELTGPGGTTQWAAEAHGEVVTSLLPAGTYRLSTRTAPEGYAALEGDVEVLADQARETPLVHPALGEIRLMVYQTAIGESGEAEQRPYPGVPVQLEQRNGRQWTPMEGQDWTSDAAGVARFATEALPRLPAGTYRALAGESQVVEFDIQNEMRTEADLVLPGETGGLWLSLRDGESGEALAGARFTLTAEDLQYTLITDASGEALLHDLPQGEYMLRQTRAAQGYAGAGDVELSIEGGTLAVLSLDHYRQARLAVEKTGVTFDGDFTEQRTRLAGEFALYTMEDGVYVPYSGETLLAWEASAALPAQPGGTVYYLRDVEAQAQGYLPDEAYHEVTLTPGASETLRVERTGDGGFFRLRHVDAQTGEALSGGRFVLYALAEGGAAEPVVRWTLEGEAYHNPEPLPTGTYQLRLQHAPTGYTLDSAQAPYTFTFEIEAYQAQQHIAEVRVESRRIPDRWEALEPPALSLSAGEDGSVALTLAAPGAQGWSLYGVTQTLGGLLPEEAAQALLAEGRLPWTLEQVSLGSFTDAEGAPLSARLWLREWQGGWRFWQEISLDEARTLIVDSAAVREVRVEYFDPATGLPLLPAGATGDGVTATVRPWMDSAQITAQSELTYAPYVLDEAGKRLKLEALAVESDSAPLARAGAEGGEAPRTQALTGGRVTVSAWLETWLPDGYRGSQEGTEGLSGLTLRLLGGEVREARAEAPGEWVFEDVPFGTYVLEATLPAPLRLWDEGSVTLAITPEEAYARLELPVYAAAGLSGRLFRDADGDGFPGEGEGGVAGARVRLLSAENEEEIEAVLTDASGVYRFTGQRPGDYRLAYELPEPLRFTQELAAEGEPFILAAGEQATLPDRGAIAPLSLSGYAWMDDRGDGLVAEGQEPVAGMAVRLYPAGEAQGTPLDTAYTGEDGTFAFGQIPPGDYQLRFALPEEAVATARVQGGNQIHLEKAGVGATETLALRMDAEASHILAGLSLPIELTLYSWKDVNYTGRLRSRNIPVPGVEWTLLRHLSGGGTEEVAVQEADDGGETVFEALGPGTYSLGYRLPEGFSPSIPADDAVDFLLPQVPGWQGEGETEPFTLDARVRQVRRTFALMEPMSISGTVFVDLDDSGQRDADEVGFQGARVEAVNPQGETIAQAETGEDGAYTLTPLRPGRYIVRVTLPEAYAFSGSGRTYARGQVARSDTHVSETMELTMRADASLTGVDAGALARATAEGRVYVAEAALAGLADVQVLLERKQGERYVLGQEAQTGSEGRFLFDTLRPGTYRLTLTLPESYVFTEAGEDLALTQGLGARQAQSGDFTLTAGEARTEISFGALVLCAMEGSLWDDQDADGLPEEGEPGLRGALVELLTEGEESPQATVTTDRDGLFAFEGLMPGVYRLRVTLPEGRVYTFQAQGGSLLPRSDERVAMISDLAVARGERLDGLLIGALALSEISGTVYLDGSDDGRRQTYEESLPGVAVTLLDETGGEIAAARADAEGVFRFAELPPAAYRLRAELPEGYVFARDPSKAQDRPAIAQRDEGQGESASFTLGFGETLRGIEIGAVRTGGLRGRVFDDALDVGLDQEGYAGVSGLRLMATDLLTGAATSAQSGDDGSFEIAGLRPGQYALTATLPEGRLFARAVEGGGPFAGTDAPSHTVEPLTLGMGQWIESFSIGTLRPLRFAGGVYLDENRIGVWDDGESGLSEVTVRLLRGEEIVAEAATRGDGLFVFENQRPGALRLELSLPERAMYEALPGLAIAPEDPALAGTELREYRAGEEPEALYVPTLLKASISGSAFEDVDSNGSRDADEPALTGVQVALLTAGENPEIVATTEADERGAYAFEALPPGAYQLRFTLPEGYLFTLGGEGERQSRAHEEADGLAGRTNPITLAMGQQVTGVLVGGIQPGLVGDTVWLDENGNGWQDDGEPPVADVEIVLYRVEAGEAFEVARTRSDAYGLYRFDMLRPGTYQVEAILPPGMAFTQVEPQLTQINSDIVLLEGVSGRTEAFDLHSAQQRRDLDIGLRRTGE